MIKYLLIALLAFSAQAEASTAEQAQLGYLTITGCPGSITPCFMQYTATNPLPVSAAASSITGILPVVNGGTGTSSIGSAGDCVKVNGGATAYTFGACGGGGGTVTLGTSTAATNPQVSGDATTGLFTGGAGQVSAASAGVEVGRFTASGLNLLTATGALQIGSLNALRLSTTGNPVIGVTGLAPATAPLSVAIGRNVLNVASVEANSVGIGHLALAASTTGVQNVAVGFQAGTAITIGTQTVAIGYQSLVAANSATGNTAIGYQNMQSASTGGQNTGVGSSACLGISTGTQNVCIGRNTLASGSAVGIDRNVAVGVSILSATNNASADDNIGLGTTIFQALTSGSTNIGIGKTIGATLTTGTNNILIGQSVDVPAVGTANWLNIGNTIYGNIHSATSKTLYVAGGFATPIATITTNTSPTIANQTILCDATGGAVTVTLPTAAAAYNSTAAAGVVFDVKKIDGSINSCTITISGGATNIDGATTNVISVQYTNRTYQSDGTQYWVK